MRPLEIRTQRIFNNLIKQKLGFDSVLKQLTTVSSVLRPAPKVQSPESSIQSPASRVQRPVFKAQLLQSSVHSPACNTCVQGPGIPVCHEKESSSTVRELFAVRYILASFGYISKNQSVQVNIDPKRAKLFS